ncbi:MAG: putative selenate reductase subunit YgfK [Oscillospiraceae bacterium]|nr:putative selenate reductase subunit YgfK [Oscillospiraceae bacterium]
MSDKMRPLPFGQLMTWALDEYWTEGSIFGVPKFFKYNSDNNHEIFGENLELPFGPAAGPHTQLAQNLIASYVAGARFFELKTVQQLDGEDLPVSKPCILAEDEGCNVEWSTELYVSQALDEYIKGWFAIKLLSQELGLGCDKGFVFNMSVGYDLEGIQTKKIDNFIEGLKNAVNTESWNECVQWTIGNLSKFENVDKDFVNSISPNVSNSITLSTLHGCPPEEIERIATYLLNEKGLHTYIKCNPTLLGYDYARETLNKLGFDYITFDDRHFKADLQYDDAVPMLKRLQTLADSLFLEFGVKLTNTFPVKITESELPGEEMYMSGRPLFPLSIELANRLSKTFDGKLRISFSGGADVRNISDIIEAGIWPVTIATTLLKPGGYMRLHQIAEQLRSINDMNTTNNVHNSMSSKTAHVNLAKLQALVNSSFIEPMYRKATVKPIERKINKSVPLTDCFIAPCREGCPFGQDVPAYLKLAGKGKHLEALRVITEKNPLPFITGTICSHRCMSKCTRYFYDESVNIRSVKLKAAEEAYNELMSEVSSIKNAPKSSDKIAIVGGGPAGLSAAYFLAKAGRSVTLYEKRNSLGGIVRHVIPEFRISETAIDNDIALIEAMGIEVKLNTEIGCMSGLRNQGFEKIIIASGAWLPINIELEEGFAIDALEFLAHLKHDEKISSANNTESSISSNIFGENIAIVGGGNTAMDTARAAKRIRGVKNVSIVYRRTKVYMPADIEELELAMSEGVKFYELVSPKTLKHGVLICNQMKLGEPDSSGRRSPEMTTQLVEIQADTVIAAVGNKAFVCSTQSKADDIYVIGDASRGPATIAEAIADAMECATAITGNMYDKYESLNYDSDDMSAIFKKKGKLYCTDSDICENERCLECKTICENCVDVCPNRANISLIVDGRPQIVHIDFMCNECGNCETFCPYTSAPYLDKLAYFVTEEDFDNSNNSGFLPLTNGIIRCRLDGIVTDHKDGTSLPQDIWRIIEKFLLQFTVD